MYILTSHLPASYDSPREFEHKNAANTRAFIKGQSPGKLTSCEDDFACLVSDNREESFSYKEVQFKKFCPE